MVIVGLLLIALACVIVGMKLASAAWLIASLIATGGAGYLLITNVMRGRRALAHPGGGASGAADSAADSALDSHAAAQPNTEVVDTADTVTGVSASTAAEPVPQAAEDSAALTGELPAAAAPSLPAAPAQRDVWVIDGRPRYHLESCAIIKGQDAEPIPWDQATEDGFMPCSLCEPDSILAGS